MTTLFGNVSFSADNNLPLQNVAERTGDPNEAIRRNNDKLSREIRVAMPAKVVSFDPLKQTIVAQPLIREKVIDRTTGDVQWVQLPQLLDVPVAFPQGGAFVLTLPVMAGDEVLIIFNDMCIDSWWTSGGIQNWNDRRRHDLSDAIAIPGINSTPNLIPAISTELAELRTKDGSVRLQLGSGGFSVSLDGSTSISSDGSGLTFSYEGNEITLSSTGVHITGTLYINGDLYMGHTHSGVQTGVGVSGPVVP